MFRRLRGTRASNHVDMIRGVAAVLVLLFHVRYRFFLDFADLDGPTLTATAWYTLTAFGHEAVMVFFVVSGFLVGSAAIRDCRLQQWSWGRYVITRSTRLFVVLIPALMLTWAWDSLGLLLFGLQPVYSGAATWYSHDYFAVAERLSPSTFLGNLMFVQSLWVVPYGSNAALWSLAYEFWSYIAFPFVALGLIVSRSWLTRILSVGIVIVGIWLISPSVAAYFPIWLFGVVVGSLPPSGFLDRHSRMAGWSSGVVFLLITIAGHTSNGRDWMGGTLWWVDTWTGLTFAAFLYVILHDVRTPSTGLYGRAARLLANCSYTLYLTHLPVLVFVRGSIGVDSWAPESWSIFLGLAVAAGTLAYSLVLASITEAHTAKIRTWVTRVGSVNSDRRFPEMLTRSARLQRPVLVLD